MKGEGRTMGERESTRQGAEEPRPEGADSAGEAAGQGDGGLEQKVIEALRTVYDPEIPVNIYELGLVYNVDADPEQGRVEVTMTLTTPNCPVAGAMPGMVEERLRMIEELREVKVNLVWDPPWTPDKMSEAARLELGFL
jgi:FeS assembly SUF system protein